MFTWQSIKYYLIYFLCFVLNLTYFICTRARCNHHSFTPQKHVTVLNELIESNVIMARQTFT